MRDLLVRIEHYYDAVPRADTRIEEIGPFTLFVSTGSWPYYARPRFGGLGRFEPADIERVRRRQRALGVPEAFEWVHEMTPSLLPVAKLAGLAVQECALMVLRAAEPRPAPVAGNVILRVLDADDAALATASAVANVGFGAGGVAVGAAGVAERDAEAARLLGSYVERRREAIERGRTVTVVAEDSSGPIAVGSHRPVGDVTEIVGVATLPAARRRGLGAAVTSALVRDAVARGTDVVFLSAASDPVAQIYARVGFHTIATACIAEGT